MATMREKVDEYMTQVNQYDAGRPTTMSADKIGNRIVPDGGQRFDPSYDAKVQGNAQVRTAMPVARFDASADSKVNSAARMPIGDGRSPLAGGTDLDKMQQNFMRFSANNQNTSDIEQKAQADSRAAQPNYFMGTDGDKLAQTVRSTTPRAPLPAPAVGVGAAQPGAPADPSKNSWAGNYAAQNADGQGIFTDPATGRTSIRLTGDAGGKFMQDQNKIIADGGGKADTRKAMPLGEYGGTHAQSPRANVPVTANPGLTLRATPVEYKRTASDGKVVGGFAASEEFTPQAATQRTAMPAMTEAPAMTGNPLVDQRNAEAALATHQREVMAMEKADKTLMQAPGSRDYISPTLTEPEQRARQNEIYAQRTQDMRDSRDAAIAQAQTRDAALAYKGLPTDEARNRAMEPYAERRATINQRSANMDMAQAQETARTAVATADAERAANEKQDVRKDATDRYVADSNTALAQTNAQVSAESKRLDREATMKAALIKLDGVKDPVQLEKLKGYNSAIEAIMSMGQTPTAEQLLEMQATYGVKDLFKPADPYAKLTIPAPGK